MEKENIYDLLEEIQTLIKENELQDGSFRFDPLRARIALEFVKLEIQKSIESRKSERNTCE